MPSKPDRCKYPNPAMLEVLMRLRRLSNDPADIDVECAAERSGARLLWECVKCGHQYPESLSWKMTKEGLKALLEWRCDCAKCRAGAAHHAITGE